MVSIRRRRAGNDEKATELFADHQCALFAKYLLLAVTSTPPLRDSEVLARGELHTGTRENR